MDRVPAVVRPSIGFAPPLLHNKVNPLDAKARRERERLYFWLALLQPDTTAVAVEASKLAKGLDDETL
jgi:hypothetical protein